MTGFGAPDTETRFLGVDLAMPLLVAPFAAATMYHRDGHLAVARAAASVGTTCVVPQLSDVRLEEIARVAPSGARFLQLYPVGPTAAFVRLGRRARDAGYRGLFVTVDYPVSGWRDRVREARFAGDRRTLLGNYDPGDPAGDELLDALHAPTTSWTWARLADAVADVGLPFAAKGILTPEDARQAVDAGATAVVVSNHGARQLDGAPAALDQLPAVAVEVGHQVDVGLDSGIRRGTDVAKALALGARATMVGMLAVHGVAAAGAEGVAACLRLLHGELVTTLMLLGCPSSRTLGPEAVQLSAGSG